MERIPSKIKKVISFLAEITLEIYVVQYVLIGLLRKIAVFPLNWLLLTSAIIAAATLLHFVSTFIIKGIERLFAALEKKCTPKTNA